MTGMDPEAQDGAGNYLGAAPTTTRPETMTRLEFSCAVLQRSTGFMPSDLNCPKAPPVLQYGNGEKLACLGGYDIWGVCNFLTHH